jgi:TATA-binding protein-associated factor Taf7
MLSTDDKNSICSDTEELEVKDKDEEEEVNDDDEEEEEEEDEDDDDEEEEDDPTIIQFELLKNFLVDDEGNNVATNLGVIAHELRRLNKILSKK